jgi:hypothetical protein
LRARVKGRRRLTAKTQRTPSIEKIDNFFYFLCVLGVCAKPPVGLAV